ncbi:ABC transporter permease subunit, partial [Klebsiella pneumoniae]|uniref:ABC transporter permease subunit n=1 Tax=Klebsiella pneumoniae TaxID=573 RepID=UPI00050CC763
HLGPVPWLVVIALAVIAVCWFILRRTTLGVHIYAVGGNMQAARLTGIKVWLVLLFVYGVWCSPSCSRYSCSSGSLLWERLITTSGGRASRT